MKSEIQLLRSTDVKEFKTLISLFEEVFEMKNFVCPDEKYLSALLAKENFFAITAKIDGQVVGGLTFYVLDQYYSVKPLAYIFDLAVLTRYQRMGIGRSLIEFTNSYCKEKGFEEVFVQADKVDDYAIDFYRSTRPSNEEQVLHFYYSLNT